MAAVLNRMTLELRLRAHTPDFDPASWIISPDLSAVSGVSVEYWKITGDVVSEMDQTEKLAVDVAALPGEKSRINAEVDAETQKRIGLGFEYPAASGKFFSLSQEAQINWLGLDAKAALLAYPYTIRTRDDLDSYDIVDEADAALVVNAAFVVKETLLGQGRAVKTAVVAASLLAAAELAAASWLSAGPP